MTRWARAVRWARAHPVAVDLTWAVALWLFFFAAYSGIVDGLALAMAVQMLPLGWRRVAPLPAAAVIAVGCLVQLVAVDAPAPSNVAVLVIVHAAAAYAPARWQSLAVLATALAGALVAAVDWASPYAWSLLEYLTFLLPAAFVMAVAVLAAWVLGDVVRRRKALIANLRAQNEALARDQAQRARLAAQDERAAIAREMHDIVAHSLSVVVVQADGGAYAARAALGRAGPEHAALGWAEPERAELERAASTLETLAATARSALGDTRRLVGVLRDSDRAAEYAPSQGLGQLDALVAGVRDAGVPVTLAVRGEVGDLGAEVGLAAYRVVQESLTNVLKHAGPDARVDVDVLRTPAVLQLRVADDGRGPVTGDGRGNGILGMTERVEVLGGRLHAGPRAGGGFEVVATIPLDRGRSTV